MMVGQLTMQLQRSRRISTSAHFKKMQHFFKLEESILKCLQCWDGKGFPTHGGETLKL